MQFKIQLFGKSRELSKTGTLTIETESKMRVKELKQVLSNKLHSENLSSEQVQELLNDCAFGNSERILADDEILNQDQNLVVLPPVCGG